MVRQIYPSALRAIPALVLCLVGLPEATAVQRTGFDHLTTGFELQGAHRDLSCEYCHTKGIFKGTPRTCQGCHSTGSPISATRKPVRHIASSDDCSLCHARYNFSPLVRVDHTAVMGSCYSCHNGVVAQGKMPDHIPADNNCDACHTTVAFNPQRMDHTAMAMAAKVACRGCHSGIRAASVPRSHVATAAECGDCHTTLSWSPARFDHTAAVGTCQGCHNGATAMGKVASHVATTLDCSGCHRYPHWTPVFAVQPLPSQPGPPTAASGAGPTPSSPPRRMPGLPDPSRRVLVR